MTPANAPSDDLDQAMQDVLLAMTMLSYGSTSAWDSNGGTQGKPGSRILVLVDRPLSDVFRERWENANGPTSRRQILEEARRELDQWRGRADRERPETLTAQQEENLILEEGKGFDVLLVAQRFRTSATRVRKVRKAAGMSPDTGELERGSDREEAAAVLESKGMAQRHIAALLDLSQPTVHRVLAQRKIRLKGQKRAA
jgi:hypothetical protein